NRKCRAHSHHADGDQKQGDRFGSGLLHLASICCCRFRLIIGLGFFLIGRVLRSVGLFLAVIRHYWFFVRSHFNIRFFWLGVGFANVLLGSRLVFYRMTDRHQPSFFLLSRFRILFPLNLFGLLRHHWFIRRFGFFDYWFRNRL